MVLSLFGHLILFYFWFLYLSSKHLSPILRLLIAFWLYSLLALVLSAFVVCGLFYLLLVNSCSLRKYFHWVIFQFKVSASFLLYIWSEFSVQNSDDLLKWFWLTYLIICVFIYFFLLKNGFITLVNLFLRCLLFGHMSIYGEYLVNYEFIFPFYTLFAFSYFWNGYVICLSHWKFLSALFFLLSVMNNVFSSYMF